MTNGALMPEKGGFSEHEQTHEEINSIEADHLAFESSPERKDDVLHAERIAPRAERDVVSVQTTSAQHSQTPATRVKDQIVTEVEKILEDGIGEFYASLPDEVKLVFKQKGEMAALEIAEMIRTLHIKVKRIVRLITDWLRTIPGVNAYFLEQEAKIKADRIVALIEARKEDESKRV